MFFRNQTILRKIDPELMEPMRVMGNEKVAVILYSHGGYHDKCRERLKNLNVTIKYELPLIEGYCIEVPYEKLMDIAALNHVKYIAADAAVKAQMNIATKEIGSNIVNDEGYKGDGIGIAFIDTGIYPHGDFTRPQNRIKAFKDFVNKKGSAYDDNGHGSFVAGVAAGNGYLSGGKYKGVAPNANIISLKALDSEGGGSASDILAAMQWVADHQKEYNIKVLSMSLGSDVKKISSNDPMVRGAESLWNKGITVVAAAGNSGPDASTITTPGISSKIITVGAADDKRTVAVDDDTIADFSSRGPVGRRTKPDVVAPGVDITSVNGDTEYESGAWVRPMATSYTTMSGTSVATPIVAGAAVLILQKNTDWTPDQVKEALMNNATPLVKDANAEGNGMIKINKSLSS